MTDSIKTLKALADPTRLRILRLLLQRDLCVCELIFILRMEQSRVSHQLRILRDADLAEDIRESRWIIYRVPGKVRESLALMFDKVLKAGPEDLREAAEDTRRIDVCLKEEVRKKRCVT
ncbi:MAG: metalloregulator ArsR/SmtB family transcription factor [Candidatus Aminicenantales bacterium]